MKVKKNDFIELDFIARIKETNRIFDLTDKEIAKKEGIFQKNFDYKPITISIGSNEVIKGLDKSLENKEIGKKYTIEVSPEQGFGKKDPKLLKIVSLNHFKKQKITPFPGLQVNINNLIGTIRSVSGGRVIVDFNHPLSGKHLIYEIKINKKLTTDQEKLEAILKRLKLKDYKTELENKIAEIKLKTKLPKEIQEALIKKIKELIPNIKKVKLEIIEPKVNVKE